jgi:starvation-inducible DNA-binding protein
MAGACAWRYRSGALTCIQDEHAFAYGFDCMNSPTTRIEVCRRRHDGADGIGGFAAVASQRQRRHMTRKKTRSVAMNPSVEKMHELKVRQMSPIATPTDRDPAATRDIAAAMNGLLADAFALYLKTKNFHWHMSGPHFRDHHLLLDEQADEIIAMTDPIAERIRKVGGSTLKSIGHVSRTQRLLDNDAEYVQPLDMLAELREDNKLLAARLREAHDVCEEHRDVATASLIETWIDETEHRTWFLFETGRGGSAT